jgi:hypothetical protein
LGKAAPSFFNCFPSFIDNFDENGAGDTAIASDACWIFGYRGLSLIKDLNDDGPATGETGDDSQWGVGYGSPSLSSTRDLGDDDADDNEEGAAACLVFGHRDTDCGNLDSSLV